MKVLDSALYAKVSLVSLYLINWTIVQLIRWASGKRVGKLIDRLGIALCHDLYPCFHPQA